MNKKDNKGITLIALVITIIIMLILAGVTINMTINGGLIDYAKESRDKTEQAILDEKTQEEEIILRTKGEEERTIDDTTGEMENFIAGEGTKETPYLIESVEDFVAFIQTMQLQQNQQLLNNKQNVQIQKVLIQEPSYSSQYENQNVKLVQTINIANDNSYINPNTTYFGDLNGDGNVDGLKTELTTSGGWLLQDCVSFRGTFDGNFQQIRNLTTKSFRTNSGVFYMNEGIIQNLIITGNSNVLIERNTQLTLNNLNTKFCVKPLAQIDPASLVGEGIGGLVGANLGIISNCTNKMNISIRYSEQEDMGGDLAEEMSFNFGKANCKVDLLIAQDNATESINVGGIAGISTGTISKCKNSGNINITSDLDHIFFIGGIVGTTDKNAQINSCENKGNITAIASDVSLNNKSEISSDTQNILNSSNTGSLRINRASEGLQINTYIGGIRGSIQERVRETEMI